MAADRLVAAAALGAAAALSAAAALGAAAVATPAAGGAGAARHGRFGGRVTSGVEERGVGICGWYWGCWGGYAMGGGGRLGRRCGGRLGIGR